MLVLWRRHKAYRERVRREVDGLIERHGASAYEVARSRRIETLRQPNRAEHRFWCAVAREMARRMGRQVGLDTATRYLERH